MRRRIGTLIAGATVATTTTTTTQTRAKVYPLNRKYIRRMDTERHNAHKDEYVKTLIDEEHWNDHEQFSGYSESVLAKFHSTMVPPPSDKMPFPIHCDEREDAFRITYEHYGAAADLLEKVEGDILHPRFHDYLEQAEKHGKDLEKVLNERYPKLHPSYKVLWDTLPVSQFHQLEDWITSLQKRRAKILKELSPEYVEKLGKLKTTAEHHMSRLRRLELAVVEDQNYFINKEQFNEEELMVIRQKVTYYRKMRAFGRQMDDNDLRHA